MNRKKATIRLCALILSAVMLLGLFGCNKQEVPSKAEKEAQQTENTTETPDNTEKQEETPLPDVTQPLSEEEYLTVCQQYYDELMMASNEASRKDVYKRQGLHMGPDEPTNQVLDPQSNADVTRGSMLQDLADNLGYYAEIDFLIGTQNIVTRGGILYEMCIRDRVRFTLLFCCTAISTSPNRRRMRDLWS